MSRNQFKLMDLDIFDIFQSIMIIDQWDLLQVVSWPSNFHREMFQAHIIDFLP